MHTGVQVYTTSSVRLGIQKAHLQIVQIVGCGLRAAGCGLWAVGCGLWAVGSGIERVGQSQ